VNWTGRRLPRFEDPALVRGEGRFVADVAIGVPAVRFVRSPYASGRIRAIEAPPGAMLVTGRDLQGLQTIKPSLSRFNYIPVGQPVLPLEHVHFVGQAVAAVVAATLEQAEDLADQVLLDIESDPAVVDAIDAIAPGAPQLHREAPGNVLVEGKLRQPGCDEAFAGAAHVVSLAFRSRRQNATPLEAAARSMTARPAAFG
jgi:carbon-monoxide dehydrogenase large subunit